MTATATHTVKTAGDLKPGDRVGCEYFDADGMAQFDTATVASVRVFAHKIRVAYAGGWGTHTYPASREVAVVS